ncbi:glycosyltransferase 87 family protein [Kitasatospora sp. NPDC051984]|uniref:glycosyltransferase 87 family protein n=1 Tax=Kitasatospora sp. NPDC051984 TaxID=3364059 RepID=UPI0037C7538A
MTTPPRQLRWNRRWLWPAGWLLCAAWAAAFPLVSPLGPHRDWGTVAAVGYLLAAVLVLPPRRDFRLPSALLALGVSGLLPLLLAVRSGEGQSEVTVIGRAGTELLAHGSPYLESPASVLDLTPYLPAMAAFGLPRGLLGAGAALGDPRLWCAVAFLATAGGAWQVLRRGRPLLGTQLLAARRPLVPMPGSATAGGAWQALRRGRTLLGTQLSAARRPLVPTAGSATAGGASQALRRGRTLLGTQLLAARRPLVPMAGSAGGRIVGLSALRRLGRAPFAPGSSTGGGSPASQPPHARTSLAPGAVALAASPVVALPLAVSGVDLPMTGLLCLALALASRRHAGGAGLALALACAMKWTAWPAVPVAVALLGAVAGRRAARRCAGVAVTVATALVAPWLVLAPGPMVRQVFEFPLGLGDWRTPAASPLPGRLLAQLGAGGWWLALALLLLGGGAVAVSLVRRPPTTAVAAADRLAVGLSVAFLLAPAGRFGYLALPLFLAVFTRLACGRPSGGGTSTPVPQNAVRRPAPLATNSSPTAEARPTSREPVAAGRHS